MRTTQVGTSEQRAQAFLCIFFIEGFVTENKFSVQTFYPGDQSDNTISGHLEVLNDSTTTIKLPSEHGGCWNVQHFADEPVTFNLRQKTAWTQILYVVANKTYFYSEKSDSKKQKSYLVKNDLVCIDRIENDWAYCTYFGKKITKGWIKTPDLNKM